METLKDILIKIINDNNINISTDGIKKGLEYIIGKRIIHRDIAARNIFLDGEQNPYIGDFGLAISPELGDNKYS